MSEEPIELCVCSVDIDTSNWIMTFIRHSWFVEYCRIFVVWIAFLRVCFYKISQASYLLDSDYIAVRMVCLVFLKTLVCCMILFCEFLQLVRVHFPGFLIFFILYRILPGAVTLCGELWLNKSLFCLTSLSSGHSSSIERIKWYFSNSIIG